MNLWGALVYAVGAYLSDRYQSRFLPMILAAPIGIAGYAILIAPVSAHRLLFRRGAKADLVATASRFAQAGLVTLGLTVVFVAFLIFDVVLGLTAGVTAAVVALVFYTAFWLSTPLVLRRRHE